MSLLQSVRIVAARQSRFYAKETAANRWKDLAKISIAHHTDLSRHCAEAGSLDFVQEHYLNVLQTFRAKLADAQKQGTVELSEDLYKEVVAEINAIKSRDGLDKIEVEIPRTVSLKDL